MADTDDISGRSAQRTCVVAAEDLAVALGSGDVPVLATPRLIAWLEAATVDAVAGALPEGSTTVGTAIEVDHVAASPLGATITVSATVRTQQGKLVVFECEAVDSSHAAPTVIAHGTISRAVVDREQFLARLRQGR